MSDQPTRRDVIKTAVAIASAAAVSSVVLAEQTPANILQSVHDNLAVMMTELVQASKAPIAGGVVLQMPCVSNAYRGVWPDDCMYPFMAMPALVDKKEQQGVLNFLTDSMTDLKQVPDRVEADGLPVLSPGATNQSPMSPSMPLHLPAAWTRYLDYCQQFGLDIPHRKKWAQLIDRSFKLIPFFVWRSLLRSAESARWFWVS